MFMVHRIGILLSMVTVVSACAIQQDIAGRWHIIRQAVITSKNQYSIIYNSRAAADEYNSLGFIDTDVIFNVGYVLGGQLLRDINAIYADFSENLLFALQPYEFIDFIQSHTRLIIGRIAADADPYTATMEQANIFIRDSAFIMGLADALYELRVGKKYPYRQQAIKVMGDLLKVCALPF